MKIYGKENLKKYVLKAIDNNNSGKLYSVLLGKPIVYYFGEDFADTFMNIRKEKNIFLKSLRLTEKSYDIQKHENYTFYNKQVRYRQNNIFTQNMLLFDGKVLMFDGENNVGEFFEDKVLFNKYITMFEKIWNTDSF